MLYSCSICLSISVSYINGPVYLVINYTNSLFHLQHAGAELANWTNRQGTQEIIAWTIPISHIALEHQDSRAIVRPANGN